MYYVSQSEVLEINAQELTLINSSKLVSGDSLLQNLKTIYSWKKMFGKFWFNLYWFYDFCSIFLQKLQPKNLAVNWEILFNAYNSSSVKC